MLTITLSDSHVANASGTAWKEGRMDFTGMTFPKLFCLLFRFILARHISAAVCHELPCHAGAQMVLTLKMISAAVCYHDGLKPAEVGPAFARQLCDLHCKHLQHAQALRRTGPRELASTCVKELQSARQCSIVCMLCEGTAYSRVPHQ